MVAAAARAHLKAVDPREDVDRVGAEHRQEDHVHLVQNPELEELHSEGRAQRARDGDGGVAGVGHQEREGGDGGENLGWWARPRDGGGSSEVRCWTLWGRVVGDVRAGRWVGGAGAHELRPPRYVQNIIDEPQENLNPLWPTRTVTPISAVQSRDLLRRAQRYATSVLDGRYSPGM